MNAADMRLSGGEMSIKANAGVRKGSSEQQDPTRAAEELFDQIKQPEASLGVFFCSTAHDLERLGRALAKRFHDTPLVGCTSAGEITPAGYVDGAITGFTLSAPDFQTVSAPIFHLNSFSIADGIHIAKELRDRLDQISPRSEPGDTFAFLIIDGLCKCEEIIVSAFTPRWAIYRCSAPLRAAIPALPTPAFISTVNSDPTWRCSFSFGPFIRSNCSRPIISSPRIRKWSSPKPTRPAGR